MVRGRLLAGRLAFLVLSAVIVVVSSEKYYWYPSGFSGVGFVELVGFYAFPVAAMLWVIEHYEVTSVWSLVVASGVFALGVEGIITPVLYEDGPAPVLALYFFAWHGLASVGFGWFLARRWALAGRRARLAVGSTLYGAAWGLWSTTYWRSESVAELEAENRIGEATWDPGQWTTSKFAIYAAVFTVVLVVAHWLIGFVWPRNWETTRRWTVATAVVLLLGLGLLTIAVPWAPLKLGLLVWLLHRMLSRMHTDPRATGFFAGMSGHVAFRQLVPLGLVSVAATVVYATIAVVEPTDDVLNGMYTTIIAVQTIAGLAVLTLALQRSKRNPSASPARRSYSA